ncbi:NADP-dependent oxidoreductase domain-containing protein [Dunaliella salina]|uniref:NADP-dependent oxidoreductase domain-containing protein n=1 Tax=Dunaliella salina TaxID=3046 RepID=A0ABQ7GX74_DUNSA|nr:NADP-dependent oxidoreductase domain-containing protein [Dunaliella salina]|eukprot:KAF5839211.1 NADP-dependent oxidoreductase domain-containing protein [Dunaliella salina]
MTLCFQVEGHPYFRNEALIGFCRANNIHVTAYSPLGSPDSAGGLSLRITHDLCMVGSWNQNYICPPHPRPQNANVCRHHATGSRHTQSNEGPCGCRGCKQTRMEYGPGRNVLISWGLQRGTSVLPKSVNPSRIAANLESAKLTLPEDDFQRLNSLQIQIRMVPATFLLSPAGPYKTLEDLWER